MIERTEFSDLMKDLCEYHGRKFSTSMSQTWFARLRNHSAAGIRKAFDEGKAAHRSMPTLNEVITYLPRYNETSADPQLRLLPAEVEFNLELWPYFMTFAKDVQSPHKQKRLEAFDTWHMTFKGVCYKHRRVDLYDAETWANNRSIHERGI